MKNILCFGDSNTFASHPLGGRHPYDVRWTGRLQALLGDKAVFALPQQAYLRPAAVAYLGSLETEEMDYLELMPMYLRAPNAERNKRLTEAANGK